MNDGIKYLKIEKGEIDLLTDLNGFEVKLQGNIDVESPPVLVEITNVLEFNKSPGYYRLGRNKINGKIVLEIWRSKGDYNKAKKMADKLYNASGVAWKTIKAMRENFTVLGEWLREKKL